MKNIVKIPIILLGAMVLTLQSCKDYLDIVPDKTQELELLFDREEQAYKALATCYSYLPLNDDIYGSQALMTDELTTPLRQATNGIEVMRGKQTVNNPLLGLWSGFNGGAGVYQQSLFRAINDCNILIANIETVPDMSAEDKATWKSEAIFLKAYYHYLLVVQYGPIPICDVNLPISASIEQIRVPRNSVEQCFNYIIATIDLALPNLPDRLMNNLQLGRIDKTIAKAIKSRVLLYAASPLFNGNAEFYENFRNHDGSQFFNTVANQEKWKVAADAAEEALTMAITNGVSLYKYKDAIPDYDKTDIQYLSIQSQYNYRYMFTDKWNEELIWGQSNPVTSYYEIQAAALVKSPSASSNEAAWQWLSPTLNMVESYYTNNGLPIDEDLTYNYSGRYDVVAVTALNQTEAQVGQQTAQLNLNREPRFYSSIGFDRGYYRGHGTKMNLKMRKNETPGGRQGSSNDYLITGYAVSKYAHPFSNGTTYEKLIKYPWPLIRMAELYLNYAEAYNEYYGPSQQVYDALNEVRARVGLPKIEVIWADATKAKSVNKHMSKEGLREIIKQERSIEMAFEGHRYNDLRRWKDAEKVLSNPVKGWSIDEVDPLKFYTVTNVGTRSFIAPRDYFQPIKLDEMTKNPNLVQNPNW